MNGFNLYNFTLYETKCFQKDKNFIFNVEKILEIIEQLLLKMITT